jgi:prepilin signal peptidase PulO-like enzyme (type II secretory pathway)
MPHLASVAYIAALGVWTDAGLGPRAWLGAAVGVAVAAVAAGRSSRAGRFVGWGLAVVIASLGAARSSHGLDACRAIGVFACGAGASWAVAHMGAEGGLVVRPKPSSPAPSIGLLAAVWWRRSSRASVPIDRRSPG